MKKYLFLIVMVICIFLNVCMAETAVVKGNIYSTDILAYVNGQPVNSYNIGGKTVIIAEELDGYGFTSEYDELNRSLYIKSYFNDCYNSFPEIGRSSPGKIVGSVYDTDIKVYFNSIEIKGYNIGGKTAICIEDVGDVADSVNADYGYSKYLCRYEWDSDNRTISMMSYISNGQNILGVSRVYHRFIDNVIYTYPDDYCAQSDYISFIDGEYVDTYTYTEDFEKNILKPLFLDINGNLTEVGYAVANPNTSNNVAEIYVKDVATVKEMIRSVKLPHKNHNEAVEYFSKSFEVIDKIENESYTILQINDKQRGILFAYINKSGGFVVDSFFAPYADREIKMWFDEKNEKCFSTQRVPIRRTTWRYNDAICFRAGFV
ncbi:MAG: hypothetical protein KIG65_03120 [Eubacteriales bacterium]|nr:hypothetical protein [Eubacteriales bacterium]